MNLLLMCLFVNLSMNSYCTSPNDYGYLENGTSMYSNLKVGDFILSEKYNNQTLHLGEIIRFKYSYPEHPYTWHRIIYLDNNIIITKGDNNLDTILEYINRSMITHIYCGDKK